jgi:hypothetical protein
LELLLRDEAWSACFRFTATIVRASGVPGAGIAIIASASAVLAASGVDKVAALTTAYGLDQSGIAIIEAPPSHCRCQSQPHDVGSRQSYAGVIVRPEGTGTLSGPAKGET